MSPDAAEPFTPAYRAVIAVGVPIMRWSRLTVTGLDCLPRTGPVLLVANHDSYWDPVAIGVAARELRQVRALAKSTLWKTRLVAAVMDGMGHIPVDRSKKNDQAIETAVRALRSGTCIGVFLEATRSLGRQLRARSGAGRLAAAVPQAVIVCARVTGVTDLVRVPNRPRIRVEFFLPSGGGWRAAESAGELTQRLLQELRAGAPPSIPGRKRTAAKHRSRLGHSADESA